MVKGIAILLSFAAVTAIAVNHFSPKGIAIIGEWEPQKGVISARAKDDVVSHEREINDIRIVKSLHEQGGALFLDARSAEMYKGGHIAGALSMPVGQVDEHMAAFSEKHSRDTRIIAYCSGRECDDSHRLSEILIDFGYKNVQVFVDGFPAWKEKGYPIE